VIIPSGWYKSKRRLDIYTDRPQQLTLGQLVDRGADYDRATYEDLA